MHSAEQEDPDHGIRATDHSAPFNAEEPFDCDYVFGSSSRISDSLRFCIAAAHRRSLRRFGCVLSLFTRWIPQAALVAISLPAFAVTITDPGQGVFTYSGAANGLSGVTWIGGNNFYAVSDSLGAPEIHSLSVSLTGAGAIANASLGASLALSTGSDPEGIAYHRQRGTFFVSDETYPSGSYIREFNATTGALVNTLTVPAVMLRDRSSLGFEALTLGAGSIWTANEQALEHESQTASSSSGSTIRLQRFNDSTLAATGQWAYRTDPYHGVPDLAVLPTGQLLVLERAFTFGSGGTKHNRIYLVDFSNATETSGIPDLDEEPFTLASKTLLWEADLGTSGTRNFEGMCLGPQLADGSYSLVLIADNNTGSTQHLYALTVSIPEPSTMVFLVGAGSGCALRRRRTA